MSRLFLSHSSDNNAEAVAIRDWLAGEGWTDVFLDVDPDRGIAAGERWERALNEAASRCEAVLFLISRVWLNSRWCMKEFNLAHKLNKRMFGLLIEKIPVAELPADLAGAWQVVDLASGQDHTMLRVVMPKTHQESHVTFSKEGLGRLRSGLTKAGLDARFFAWPPERDPNRPPYRGLKPLEAEDAGIFFGRDGPIVEALDTLRGVREGAAPRLLIILGASGAGKSSFLRAGLLPRLARDDRNFLPLPAVRPERAAIGGETGLLRSLETALAAAGIPQSRVSIRDAIRAGRQGLQPLLAQLADRAFARLAADDADAKRPAIILPIDQAEELFLGEGAEEGQALLALIADLVREDPPSIVVVFTIRSDSYDRLETAKPFEGMRQQTLPLLPMPRGAYQTVIEGPAARLRDTDHPLSVEPRLTQRLLEDIETGGGSDALPLLAFTLEQLYLDYGGSGALRLADYERFGGVRGAIEAAVERALAAADNDSRIPRDRDARLTLLRRGLVPWLAGIDPETSSPRRRIARLADIPAEAAPLVQHLVEQRLLATDRIVSRDGDKETSETTIEPAHEALLRQWGLLRGWLEEDFAALTTLEGVKRAARDWAANGRHADWLNHSGTRLEDAEKIAARTDLAADLKSDARDYLRQCREQEDAERAERRARLEREREEQERRVRDAEMLAAANRRTAHRTGIGLVAALILALLAGWQWRMEQSEKQLAQASAEEAKAQRDRAEQAAQEAKAQRDRAEQAITVATGAANSLIFDIALKFRNMSGVPIAMVEDILDKARQLQQALAAAAGKNEALQRSQAVAMSESAGTLLTLGDTSGALAAAQQAQSILEPLLAASPDNSDWQRLVAVNDNRIGDVLTSQGKLDDALASYQKGLELVKALVAKDANNVEWQRDLSIGDEKVGSILSAQGRLDEALAAFNDSLAIRKALVAKRPAESEWQRDVSVSDENIGVVLAGQGRLDEALAAFRDSLSIRKSLVAKDAGNTQWQRDVSVIDNKIGDVLKVQGKLDDALTAYRDGLAIVKSLVVRDSGNTEWRRDLSVSDNKVGDVLSAQGKTNEALAAYQDSLTIRKALSAKDPGNTDWQRDVSIGDEKIGDALKAQGKLDDALAAYRDSLAIRKGLAAKNPNIIEWQRDISVADNKIGDVLGAQGKLDDALAAYQDGLAIAKALAARNPGNTQWQRDLSFSDNRLGDALRALGKFDEALGSYRDALAIAKTLAAKDPSNTEWQRDLTIADNRAGDILKTKGKLDEALALYREGLVVAKSLVAVDANNTLWMSDLQISVNRVGGIAYNLVLVREFTTALGASDDAVTAAPNSIWLQIDRAHALMFLGRTDDARALYLRYQKSQDVLSGKSWISLVLDDFAAFRKAGLTSPLMDDIEKLYST